MLASLRRIAALIRKELLAVLKDARTRNMLLLQPVLQCLLFGYAATLDLNNVPYAVLDRDRSAASPADSRRWKSGAIWITTRTCWLSIRRCMSAASVRLATR